jgi:hypothetical protein
MSLFTTLEQYAEEILDAVKARAQQLEQAFGTHSPELTHIVSTLEAHVAIPAPASSILLGLPSDPVEATPVEPVVEVPAEVEAAEEK